MMSWSDSGCPAWREILLADCASDTLVSYRAELGLRLTPERVALRHAGSRKEAIELVEAGGVDLAVLWADAAGVHGLRTLEIIRSLTSELPCLLVTPDTSPLTLRRALELRAYSVLRHPVDSEVLAALLLSILRKR
jgi:DNA-binding NarL/FixJ family response regulator